MTQVIVLFYVFFYFIPMFMRNPLWLQCQPVNSRSPNSDSRSPGNDRQSLTTACVVFQVLCRPRRFRASAEVHEPVERRRQVCRPGLDAGGHHAPGDTTGSQFTDSARCGIRHGLLVKQPIINYPHNTLLFLFIDFQNYNIHSYCNHIFLKLIVFIEFIFVLKFPVDRLSFNFIFEW